MLSFYLIGIYLLTNIDSKMLPVAANPELVIILLCDSNFYVNSNKFVLLKTLGTNKASGVTISSGLYL